MPRLALVRANCDGGFTTSQPHYWCIALPALLLTTECVVVEKKEKEKAPPMPGGGGGMGGMY